MYIGVTNNLVKRVWEHKNKVVEGFTKRYNVDKLVYYEVFDNPEDAMIKEKQLKKWKRAWKERLINEFNPEWKDIYDHIK